MTNRVDTRMIAGELALWKAVLTQALIDAKSQSPKSEKVRDAKLARIWLTDNNPDFETVCDYADLNPEYVRSKIDAALKRDLQWRLPAGEDWRTKAHQEALARLRAKQAAMILEDENYTPQENSVDKSMADTI